MATLTIKLGLGPDDGAGDPLTIYPIPSQQFSLDSGSVYGSFTLPRVNPLAAVPASSITIVTAVTGSSSAQSVNVSYTGDITADPAAYWVVEPGTANQEVVRATAITDITHATFKMFNSHAVGSLMLKIQSVYTKFGLPDLRPDTTLIDPVLVRFGPLPDGVFDHFVIAGSYGTIDYTVDDAFPWVNGAALTPSISAVPLVVPQYDSGSVSGTAKPTNGAAIYTGTISGSGGIYAQPRIQLLFTVAPEPVIAPEYRIWADV